MLAGIVSLGLWLLVGYAFAMIILPALFAWGH